MPREAIREKALELGFDAIGFATPDLGAGAENALADFLRRGYHGDMGWLAGNADRRSAPRRLWDDTRSIIVVGTNYTPANDPLSRLEQLSAQGRGMISVYAQNRDYHDVMKKRLRVLARWMHDEFSAQVKLFVDTAPVMEKPLAQNAALGWQGKHTNLVSRQFGSWMFLGEVFTDLALQPDDADVDHCGSCQRCLDICPTNAFPAPYKLDARRCISYLTIEHKGHIPPELRAPMGNRIYGCDDCLAVCPWNKFAAATTDPNFLPRAELTAPRLADLAALDDDGFRKVFAGSPIKRTGRDRFVRNVLIAIGNSGNSGNPALSEAVEARLTDDAVVVRAMAVWSLARLVSSERFIALRARHMPRETDGAVCAEWRQGSVDE
ncbi:MAG: tRNA epoxyqueuosine(34) reductase QueG [Alphaproteobacteria bacterium]|nr:tRNA epoxyqueuosine(34) reductase QueG [Alphaproteobacteria bacterium]